MDTQNPAAAASQPTDQRPNPLSFGKRIRQNWFRLETFYRDWRLLCTIVGAAASVIAAIARGLDLLITVVLGLAIGTILWLSWDAAARTKKWLPPVLALFTVLLVLGVAAAADWRAAFLQLFSDPPSCVA